MVCPECGKNARVIRSVSKGTTVVRNAFCEHCGAKFKTEEVPYTPDLTPYSFEEVQHIKSETHSI